MKLKPILDFETRSGIKPVFDMGDVIQNDFEKVMIRNITSSNNGVLYLGIKLGVEDANWIKEYHSVNKEFQLIRKGNEKVKYYFSNGGCFDVDLFDENFNINYPSWFEKEYKKLLK